jgi:hypothetical protein
LAGDPAGFGRAREAERSGRGAASGDPCTGGFRTGRRGASSVDCAWIGEARGALADALLVEEDPLQNLGLIEDPETNLLVIMQDGLIYNDTLPE